MNRKPVTKQRSPWTEAEPLNLYGIVGRRWHRNVTDGRLTVIISNDPGGLHLSISHPRRYPTWDEITHARYELLPDHLDFVMHLPPPGEYVAVHDNCFHLHEHPPVNSD